MKPEEIIEYCKINLPDISIVESWGETGVFYNPDNRFKRGVYVLTRRMGIMIRPPILTEKMYIA